MVGHDFSECQFAHETTKETACRLTGCVSGSRAGVDKAQKRDSAKALKTAKKRGDSLLSTARCVGPLTTYQVSAIGAVSDL
jgi:hypothetical protein